MLEKMGASSSSSSSSSSVLIYSFFLYCESRYLYDFVIEILSPNERNVFGDIYNNIRQYIFFKETKMKG